MQTSFVKELFARHHKKKLFPVLEDIIAIHGALDRSLYAGPLVKAGYSSFDDETLFALAPGTIALSLKYDFNALLTVGELTLEEFLAHYQAQKSYLVIYNCGGAVKTLSIDRTLSRLLDSFTGTETLRQVCGKKTTKARREIDEFLAYAVEEQMIHGG